MKSQGSGQTQGSPVSHEMPRPFVAAAAEYAVPQRCRHCVKRRLERPAVAPGVTKTVPEQGRRLGGRAGAAGCQLPSRPAMPPDRMPANAGSCRHASLCRRLGAGTGAASRHGGGLRSGGGLGRGLGCRPAGMRHLEACSDRSMQVACAAAACGAACGAAMTHRPVATLPSHESSVNALTHPAAGAVLAAGHGCSSPAQQRASGARTCQQRLVPHLRGRVAALGVTVVASFSSAAFLTVLGVFCTSLAWQNGAAGGGN